MREESRYKSDVPNDFRALPVLSFLDTLRARRARLTRVVPDLNGTANDVDSDPILAIPFSSQVFTYLMKRWLNDK